MCIRDRYNPATGETGIIYGDSEMEGGGAKNGRMYAGEAVSYTHLDVYKRQPLSTSLIVCGNYEEDYALGIEINKNITCLLYTSLHNC